MAGARGSDDRRSTVESHVRRLNPTQRAALVADIWETRGFETRREDGIVEGQRDGETVRIGVAGLGDIASRDRTLDYIVSFESQNSSRDAQTLDASALTERLWYALDSDQRRAVCRRQFGATPAELRPPLWTRLQQRVTTPALVGALLVVLLGASAVAGFSFAPNSPGTSESATTDGGVTPVPTPAPGETLPPGVGDAGIQNIERLADAHERALLDRPYTLWVDQDGQEFDGNWTVVDQDVDITTDGERYLIDISEGPGAELRPSGREPPPFGGNRTLIATLYHDGNNSFAALYTGTEPSYQVVSPREEQNSRIPTPSSLRTHLVSWYLSAPETNLTGTVERDGRTYYRVTGRGTPRAPDLSTVENYTVTALVDGRGLVRNLTATYDQPVGSAVSLEKTFQVTYARLDATTVETPDWYREQFDSDV